MIGTLGYISTLVMILKDSMDIYFKKINKA